MERNYTLDIAKGIAICLMVVGHTACPRFLCSIIYQFHMPLFFICSGYFFTPKTQFLGEKGLISFWKKKIAGLWFPFIYWGFPFMLISPLLVGWGYDHAAWSSSTELIKNCIRMVVLLDCHYGQAQPGFWFIKTLFHATILVSLLFWLKSKINQKNDITVLILLMLGSLILTFHQFETFYKTLFGAVYAGVYFCVGYLFRNFFEEKIKYSLGLGLLCFFLTIGGALFYGCNEFLDCNKPNAVYTSIIFALSGFLATMTLANWVGKINVCKKNIFVCRPKYNDNIGSPCSCY